MLTRDYKLKSDLHLSHPKVKWSTLDKIGGDMFVAGGLDFTTDPYTQVIKLVDSSGDVISSRSLGLPGKVQGYGIASFQYFASLDLLVCRCSKRYVHLLALDDGQLRVVLANLDVCGGDLSSVNHIVMTEDNKLLVGTSKGLAVVKLISN